MGFPFATEPAGGPKIPDKQPPNVPCTGTGRGGPGTKRCAPPSVGAAHMMCHDTHLDSTRWLRGCGCDPSPSPRRGRALQPILLDLLCFAFDRDNHRRITFHTSRSMQGQEVQVQQSHSRARSGFPTNPMQISVRGTPFLFLSGVPRKWISQPPGSTSHRNCPATVATKPPQLDPNFICAGSCLVYL